MSFPLKASTLAILAVAGVAGCGGSSGVDHLAVWSGDNAITCPVAGQVADASCYYEVIAGTEAVNLSVAAVDANNRLVRDYTGTWSFTSTDSGAVLPSAYTLKATDYGSKTDFSIMISQAGDYTITVKDGGGKTGLVKIKAAALEPEFAISYKQSADDTGAALKYTVDITVEAVDQSGRDIPNYAGTAVFTITSSDASVAVPTLADYTFTVTGDKPDAGKHVFKAVVFATSAAAPGPKFTISAADATNGLTGSKKIAFTEKGAPSASARFLVTGPTTATAGTPVTYTVRALDKYNQVLQVETADNKVTGQPCTVVKCTTPGNYTGKVTITATQTLTRVADPFSFTDANAGTATFSVTFFEPTTTDVANKITVTDADGITGSLTVTVN